MIHLQYKMAVCALVWECWYANVFCEMSEKESMPPDRLAHPGLDDAVRLEQFARRQLRQQDQLESQAPRALRSSGNSMLPAIYVHSDVRLALYLSLLDRLLLKHTTSE